LAAILEGGQGQFVCGGAGGPEDKNFGVARMGLEECGRALEERCVGARLNERAGGHKQL
jgi:hypothetical protein